MLVQNAGEPQAPKDVKIHVIVPFYNCASYLNHCLLTLVTQDHANLHVVLMDDASTDESSQVAQSFADSQKWTYHRNDKNMKCPYNLWYAIKYLAGAQQTDVIFLLDGDDWLPHNRVMTRIAELYSEADTWMTYGQYMSDPPDWGCTPAQLPDYSTIVDRNFRKVNCFFNHPIAFRKFLWDAIPEEALKDRTGEWFKAGYDRTIFYPLIELATDLPRSDDTWEIQQENHWRFINEILYVYNSGNPDSDWRVMAKETLIVDEVHNRPPLNPLKVRRYV